MEIVLLVVGLLVGALVGYFFALNKAKPVATDSFESQFAAAAAKVEVLEQQVRQQEQARLDREAKDREEARLLEAIAPVRENLAKMQAAVTKMEEDAISSLAP